MTREPGDVPAGTREALDEPERDRLVNNGHDDRGSSPSLAGQHEYPGGPHVTMTSTERATSSEAIVGNSSIRPSPHRVSITTFCPSIQPRSRGPSRNALSNSWNWSQPLAEPRGQGPDSAGIRRLLRPDGERRSEKAPGEGGCERSAEDHHAERRSPEARRCHRRDIGSVKAFASTGGSRRPSASPSLQRSG